MKTNIEVELKPFSTPNFVLIINSDMLRKETSIPLKDLDGETLDKMCDEFRTAIFKKAGKRTPPTCDNARE